MASTQEVIYMEEDLKIKEWRKNNNLTLEQAAKIFGVHLGYLSQLERGKRVPNLKLALKIKERTYGFVCPEDWNVNHN